jgi:hypothetical protein
VYKVVDNFAHCSTAYIVCGLLLRRASHDLLDEFYKYISVGKTRYQRYLLNIKSKDHVSFFVMHQRGEQRTTTSIPAIYSTNSPKNFELTGA